MTHKYQISSDQEFLNGVKRKINTVQLTIEEEKKLKVIRCQMILSQCVFALFLLIVSAFCWIFGTKHWGSQGTLYIWALVMLSLSSLYEYFRELRSGYRWRS